MTGVAKLVRLILRRDRVLLPLWVLVLGLVPVSYATSFETLFPTAADRLHYYTISTHNAGFIALYGPLSGPSLGELVFWRAGFIPVMIGLFSLLTVIRHTRTDEEAGRTELIGAAAVSRQAQLFAALLVTFGANVVLGGILAAAMAGQGLSVAGSVAFGAEFTAAGWMFAAVGAITAQLSGTARGARGIAVLALGVAWVLRLGGDVSATGSGGLSWLSWLSPIGWVQHVFAYGSNNWFPIALAVMFTLVATGVAVVLRGRRDVGAGLLPDRLGPASAAPTLRSPLALAWRLHRGLLFGWTAGYAALGLIFGAVANSVADLTHDSPAMATIFARLGGAAAIVDSYFASTAEILGLIAAGYAIQATLRMRDEEQTGHAEVLLTNTVPRWRWASSHLVFALFGPAVVLAVAGILEGLVYAATAGSSLFAHVGDTLESVLAQVPAMWVMVAVAVLLFGVLPRFTGLAWGALALCLLILLVGQPLELNQWILDISPFTHVPHLPGAAASALPFVALLLVAAAIGTAGLLAFRRRDLPA